MERIYRQETGIFATPSWPASLPVHQKAIDDDKGLRDVQGHWGMAAFALSWGVVRLEAALLSVAR